MPGRASILNKDYMEGKAKGSLVGAQKKLDLNKNNKIDKEDFSMLRDKKAVGSKVITKNIIDFAEKLMAKEAPKKAAERRASIKSAAEAEDIIVNKINSDPFAMNEMPLSILENLSVKNKAKIGLADEYSSEIAESTGGMLKSMSPKEAAENLLAFEDDEIFDYMSTLNARDLRQFKDNLSDDDFEAFGDYMPSLGPREKKNQGGKGESSSNDANAFQMLYETFQREMKAARDDEARAAIQANFQQQTQNFSEATKREVYKLMDSRKREADGGSMLVPPEMEALPVDTYTPEEQANAEKEQVPDVEMEEKYMDFIFDESLQADEQEYLMNALESDPKLSDIFDKVIMTASEFSGAGEVEGPGTGVSDSIPARLSDGEFVITEKATSMLGADNLQRMMDDAERMADGGVPMREKRQIGGMLGMPNDPEEELEAMSQMRSTDAEVNEAMLRSNQVPSLRRY